jgi:hypothetical protein
MLIIIGIFQTLSTLFVIYFHLFLAHIRYIFPLYINELGILGKDMTTVVYCFWGFPLM